MFTRLADAASTGADTLIAIPSAVVNASIVCFFMIFLQKCFLSTASAVNDVSDAAHKLGGADDAEILLQAMMKDHQLFLNQFLRNRSRNLSDRDMRRH